MAGTRYVGICSIGKSRDAVRQSVDVVGYSTSPTVGIREYGYQFPIGWLIVLEYVGFLEYIAGYDSFTQAEDAVL
jgi:hypothetical protein